MTIHDLETAASKGCKRDDESGRPDRDEIMAAIEIKTKGQELSEEIQRLDGERWNKDVIAAKTSAIVWFCARLAGMYGVNLDETLRKRAEEAKGEAADAKPEKPVAAGAETKHEASVQRPTRKPLILSKNCKPRRRRRA